MASRNFKAILASLEQRGDVQRMGKGWKTRCPAPDHEDIHPSFHLYPGGGGKCFSACSRYWSPRELAELLGIQLEDSDSGLTVETLAEGEGNHSALTDPKGSTQADLYLYHRGDAFWAETEPELQVKVADLLDRYLIADDVEREAGEDGGPGTVCQVSACRGGYSATTVQDHPGPDLTAGPSVTRADMS